jgi:hypothetical protein
MTAPRRAARGGQLSLKSSRRALVLRLGLSPTCPPDLDALVASAEALVAAVAGFALVAAVAHRRDRRRRACRRKQQHRALMQHQQRCELSLALHALPLQACLDSRKRLPAVLVYVWRGAKGRGTQRRRARSFLRAAVP